jgi:hypothetical protein
VQRGSRGSRLATGEICRDIVVVDGGIFASLIRLEKFSVSFVGTWKAAALSNELSCRLIGFSDGDDASDITWIRWNCFVTRTRQTTRIAHVFDIQTTSCIDQRPLQVTITRRHTVSRIAQSRQPVR